MLVCLEQDEIQCSICIDNLGLISDWDQHLVWGTAVYAKLSMQTTKQYQSVHGNPLGIPHDGLVKYPFLDGMNVCVFSWQSYEIISLVNNFSLNNFSFRTI